MCFNKVVIDCESQVLGKAFDLVIPIFIIDLLLAKQS